MHARRESTSRETEVKRMGKDEEDWERMFQSRKVCGRVGAASTEGLSDGASRMDRLSIPATSSTIYRPIYHRPYVFITLETVSPRRHGFSLVFSHWRVYVFIFSVFTLWIGMLAYPALSILVCLPTTSIESYLLPGVHFDECVCSIVVLANWFAHRSMRRIKRAYHVYLG